MVNSARTPQKYLPVAKSKGKFEIQGQSYIFNTGSAIIETPVTGEKFYNPNTDRLDFMLGQTQYENITVTAILSAPQFNSLRTLYRSEKARDGSLSATHQIGTIITVLTQVKLLRLEYGAFDRASNSVADISLEVSFSGTGATQEAKTLPTDPNTSIVV